MRSARSGAFIAVMAGAVLIETGVLHLVLVRSHPVIAWTLTLSSLSALWWITMDHRALSRTVLTLAADGLAGHVGRRLTFTAPLSALKSVGRPQLMPISGSPKGYLNATKPASPNVLIVFRAPVNATVLGIPRPLTQLALRLDDDHAFMTACADVMADRQDHRDPT